MTRSLESLERLIEGNRRFASGALESANRLGQDRRFELIDNQEPFAIILGCSDSRVPAEIVFDQGLGDLFVIRVAGNIVASSQVGSVEFAVERFGTRLVVVLGHSKCGAVVATLEDLRDTDPSHSRHLRAIVDRVRPPVEKLLAERQLWDPEELVGRAVRANIEASTEQLKRGSPLLEKLIREDGLMVVGAEYALHTGLVEFFSGGGDTR